MAALNRLDLWMTAGLPNVSPRFPFVVGSDGAGVVEAVGSGVRSIRPGDRVMINPGLACGHCAACLDDDESLCREFRDPRRASARHGRGAGRGAGGESRGCSRGDGLAGGGGLQPGHTDRLANAAPGAPGFAPVRRCSSGASAVECRSPRFRSCTFSARARSSPARATPSSSGRRRLGAAVTMNHAREDVVSEVRRDTGGRGVDVVVDSVGEQTWRIRSARCAAAVASSSAAPPPGPSSRWICDDSSGTSGASWARPWAAAGSMPRSSDSPTREGSGRSSTASCRWTDGARRVRADAARRADRQTRHRGGIVNELWDRLLVGAEQIGTRACRLWSARRSSC